MPAPGASSGGGKTRRSESKRRAGRHSLKSSYVPEGEHFTPFTGNESALNVIDNYNGQAQKSARTWQLVVIVETFIVAAMLGMLFYAIRLPKSVPVIVTVNEEGAANYVGKVDSALYNKSKIPEIAKIYQIKELIRYMNLRVIDEEAQQMYVNKAAAIVQGGAATMLNSFFTQNNPFDDIGSYITAVEIEEPMKQTDKTYVVFYDVEKKSTYGYSYGTTRYSMTVTIDYYEGSQVNPLGVYVTSFDIKTVSQTK